MDNKGLWEELAMWKEKCRFVELSHEVSAMTPHWTGFPEMRVGIKFDYPAGFRVQEFTMVSQYGTHVDAPLHFVQGARDLKDIAAEELILPLCVIDITAKVNKDPDYMATEQDILDWEETHGDIPDKAFVALRSDWSKRKDMDNCDAQGNKHYPGWTLDSLKYLVEKRNITAIGHETPDTDAPINFSKYGYICERYILEKECYQVELMKNLDEIPPAGSLIFCGFPRVKDASGFTARCIAVCMR